MHVVHVNLNFTSREVYITIIIYSDEKKSLMIILLPSGPRKKENGSSSKARMREQIKEFWSMRILSFLLESCSVQQKVAL